MVKKYFLAFLSAVLIFTSIPFYHVEVESEVVEPVVETETSQLVAKNLLDTLTLYDPDYYWDNPGFAVGNTITLDLINFSFYVTDDPASFSQQKKGEDEYNLYNGIFGYDFSSDTKFVVKNYYYNEERGELWFKLDVAPGYELPEKMLSKQYMLYWSEDDRNYGFDPYFTVDREGNSAVFDEEGQIVSEMTLPFFETEKLTAESTLVGSVEYQWQIYVNNEWVNITNASEKTLNVYAGMLVNAIVDQVAKIRCVSTSGSKSVTGTPIEIYLEDYVYPVVAEESVSFNFRPELEEEIEVSTDETVNEVEFIEEQEEILEETVSETESLDKVEDEEDVTDTEVSDGTEENILATDPSDEVVEVNEENQLNEEIDVLEVDENSEEQTDLEQNEDSDEVGETAAGFVASLFGLLNVEAEETDVMLTADDTYNVVVRYLFGDGSEAANPYTAVIQAGTSFSTTVTFPFVQGYIPTYNGLEQESLEINEVVNGNLTYTVTYVPTLVDYSIEVYFQNIENDDYTFQDVYKLQGLTGTLVPHIVDLHFEGMYELLHETPEIAADGSTRLQVYFNREYYLMQFDLAGGRGVYSMYSRYGAKFRDNVGTPIYPGYSFVGWDDITPPETGDGQQNVVPETIPSTNMRFRALWKANETVLVRIAIWGQNPNDDLYSYEKSIERYVKPGTVIDFSSGGYICGLTEHKNHDSSCATCGETEHKHDTSCYDCTGVTHVHKKECFDNVGNEQNQAPNNAPSDPKQGQIYVRYGSRYIFINDSWYRYNVNTVTNGTIIEPNDSCDAKGHTHKDSCLKTQHKEHVHDASCYTECTLHTHSDIDCRIESAMDSDLWDLNEELSEPVTVAADGTTVVNIYYDRTTFTLTFKASNNGSTVAEIKDRRWGSSISGEFSKAPFSTTYNGRAWKCTETSKYSAALQTLDIMPQFDAEFTLYSKSSNTLKTIYYYVQTPGTTININSWPTNTNDFELLKTVDTYFTYTTYDEEYHEIQGYERYSKAVSGYNNSSNRKDFTNNELNLFYYLKGYTVDFYSENELSKSETVINYTTLEDFKDYEPKLPAIYDAGSHEFAGWYYNPEFTGSPLDLSQVKIENKNLQLYAKWDPVYHNVEIYSKKNSDGTFSPENGIYYNGDEKLDPVLHGHKVFETNFVIPNPTNPPYQFIGWFTTLPNGEEQMWDFEHSVVSRDTVIYAKWSSQALVPYTINYILEDGTKIADSVLSSSLAGTTITFNAKAGNQLYSGYQSGYFPKTSSHSITMEVEYDAEGNVVGLEYNFVYIKAKDIQYTVKYVDNHGNSIGVSDKIVTTTHAIVTEKFVYVDGYTPDAYQKTLIISAENPEVNNVITFVYKKDSTQGVYQVTHYIQNNDGSDYYEGTSYGDIGLVGSTIEVVPLTLQGSLPGFTFSHATVNGKSTSLTDGAIKADIIKEGVEIKLYYTRNKYSYKIQYLDKDTLEVIKSEDIVKDAYFGTTVTCIDPPEITNYDFLSTGTCIIAVDDVNNPVKNIVTVYYQEETVEIKYEVVDGVGGKVDPESTKIKVKAREGSGATSTATPDKNYSFVGWYSDSSCEEEYLITTNEMLVLTKQVGEIWEEATYYAKFEHCVGDLTITKTNADDSEQVFVYEIVDETDSNKKYYLTITGNGSNTLYDLPFGKYTVTQKNGWSWRYDESDEIVSNVDHNKTPGYTELTFDDSVNTNKWLTDNSPLYKNQRGND